MTFSSPAANANLAVGTTSVTVAGTITEARGGSASTSFTGDGASVYSKSGTGAFSFTWSGLGAGSHTVRGTLVTLGVGCTGSYTAAGAVAFTIAAPAAPTVLLTVGTSYTAPATIPITANVTDNDGIQSVTFYDGGAVIRTLTTAPWTISYTGSTQGNATGVGPGTHSISAQAVNVAGQIGASSVTNVTVATAAPPTVSLTAAASRTMLPATLDLTASVSDPYTVSSLKFIVNGTPYSLAASNSGSYALSVPGTGGNPGIAASYSITAQAADYWGGAGTSSVATINETAHPLPQVALNSAEATAYTPAEVAAASTATDVDGIAGVYLSLNGTQQPGELTVVPYNFLIGGVAAGTYQVTVTATNLAGQSATTAAQTLTIAGAPNITGDATSQTRTTVNEYDPITGRLVKVIIEPESSNLCLVKTYGRDAFGNPTASTTRNCNGSDANEAAAPSGLPAFGARSSTVAYDTTGTFSLKGTNALAQSTTATYDARFGTALTMSDANGLVTTQQIDALGRPTQSTAPDGTQTQYQYSFCSGVNSGTASCPTLAAYQVQATPLASDGKTQIGSIKITYFDSLSRVVQTQTQSFNGTPILATKSYDTLGRLAENSNPYLSGASPTYTSYQYDVLNRITYTQNAISTATTYSYNGVETVQTDGLGNKLTKTNNGLGKTIATADAFDQISTYQYDPFGNLIYTADPQGVSKSVVYDIRGRKTQASDPDMGTWFYSYDSAGELVQQTDAKSQVSNMTYDGLGRMLTRVEPDLTSFWEYDVARPECTTAAGKAIGSQDKVWTSTGYSRIECFDGIERPVQERIAIGSHSFVSSKTYDSSSRPITSTYPAGSVYPTGFVVTSAYNAYGYLTQLTSGAAGPVIWQANAMDAMSNVTSESMSGGAFTTSRTFDAIGRITAVGAGSSASIQNDSFSYDAIGNLTSRSWIDSSNNGYTEAFSHDALNRLTGSTGPANKTYTYDYSGNITSKSDVGTYSYNSGSHQVAAIALAAGGNTAFAYDANGNLTAEDGVSASWSSYNMALTLTRGSASDSFQYGPEHQRVTQVAASSTATTTSNYVNSSFETVANGSTGVIEYHNYITADSRRVAMLVDSSIGTSSWRYFQQDHLGSVEVVTDQNGSLIERLSYDPWGKRRNTNGTDSTAPIIALDNRGFTDQEELDSLSLINLNGRIYDPTIGRFLSADPTIQSPFDLQNHNRYSYVLNRPLDNTDPTGFLYTHTVLPNPIAITGPVGSNDGSLNFNTGGYQEYSGPADPSDSVCFGICGPSGGDDSNGSSGASQDASGTGGSFGANSQPTDTPASHSYGTCDCLSAPPTNTDPQFDGAAFSMSAGSQGNWGDKPVNNFQLGWDAEASLDNYVAANAFAAGQLGQWTFNKFYYSALSVTAGFGGFPDYGYANGPASVGMIWDLKAANPAQILAGEGQVGNYLGWANGSSLISWVPGGSSILFGRASVTLPGEYATYTFTLAVPGVVAYTTVFDQGYTWSPVSSTVAYKVGQFFDSVNTIWGPTPPTGGRGYSPGY